MTHVNVSIPKIYLEKPLLDLKKVFFRKQYILYTKSIKSSGILGFQN